MKNLILLFNLVVVLILTSCGKASEDREAMYKRAKVFQDSIAFVLRSSMEAAAAPAPGMAPPVIVPTPTAAPTATSK